MISNYFWYFLDFNPMRTESRVKFRSPQNISGASQQNRVAAFALTAEVDGDLF